MPDGGVEVEDLLVAEGRVTARPTVPAKVERHHARLLRQRVDHRTDGRAVDRAGEAVRDDDREWPLRLGRSRDVQGGKPLTVLCRQFEPGYEVPPSILDTELFLGSVARRTWVFRKVRRRGHLVAPDQCTRVLC